VRDGVASTPLRLGRGARPARSPAAPGWLPCAAWHISTCAGRRAARAACGLHAGRFARALSCGRWLGSATTAVRSVALPADASCEDLEVDAALPFLDMHVSAALAAGAAPYLSEEQRLAMGVVRPSHNDEARAVARPVQQVKSGACASCLYSFAAMSACGLGLSSAGHLGCRSSA